MADLRKKNNIDSTKKTTDNTTKSKIKDKTKDNGTKDNVETPIMSQKSTNVKQTTIFEQMELYDYDRVQNSIIDLEEIKEAEESRLTKLKNNKPDENIRITQEFVSKSKTTIMSQHDKLISLEKDIKNIIEEADDFESHNVELKQLSDSKECCELAEKIRTIKKTIDNLNLFLVKKKVTSYKN